MQIFIQSVAIDKCMAVFPEIVYRTCQSMKTEHLFVRLVERPHRLDVVFSHYLALNLIN